VPDKWIEFKRVFGAYARRGGKATNLVDELAVQANVLRDLGRIAEANAMDLKHQQAVAALALAQQGGETTQAYKDLGDVKTQARAARRDPVAADAVTGMLSAVPALLKSIQSHLNAAGTLNTKLQARKDQIETAHGLMRATTPKDAVEKLEAAARKLLDEVLQDSYAKNPFMKKEIGHERSKAYGAMLKARYGIDAESPVEPGLDKFYEALSLLPAAHIAHSSLKNVQITTGTDLGDYNKIAKRIRLNAVVVKKHPTLPYQMDGASGKVDTFKVTTLHEVAHSIDDKAGVMAAPAGAGFGDWNVTLTIDDVAQAYWATISAAVGIGHQVAMLAEIRNALGGQPTARPPSVPDPDWKKAGAALKICAALAADKKPWVKPYPIGDRCYFQDGGSWRSYSLAARNGLTVRTYQWRAPGEWFAEIYAASWMFKKKPSGTVHASAAKYMYRGE
jgi:hypothetical protein